jgi:rfaE bifunctional protein kinase chain/domain
MNIESIESVFKKFNDKKIIVIGDGMVDCYVWGEVNRVSPEAPVPVITVNNREFRAGGAANVALNLHSLGAIPILYTIVGNDENGRILRSILKSYSISEKSLFVDKERVTTSKSRIYANRELTSRIDDETTEYISSGLETQIVTDVCDQCKTGEIDLILFVDYDKGVVTPSLFNAINDFARQKGIPTAVDPKIRNFGFYKNITLFKPNFEEFTNGLKIKIPKDDFQLIGQKAISLNADKGIKVSLVSLSEQGVLLAHDENTFHFQSVFSQITDVAGAGDTVISVASLAMISGADFETMAVIANVGGGLVCMEQGVTPVNKNKLLNKLRGLNPQFLQFSPFINDIYT